MGAKVFQDLVAARAQIKELERERDTEREMRFVAEELLKDAKLERDELRKSRNHFRDEEARLRTKVAGDIAKLRKHLRVDFCANVYDAVDSLQQDIDERNVLIREIEAALSNVREEYNDYVQRVVSGEAEHITHMQRGIAGLSIDGVITASLAAELCGVSTVEFRTIANDVALRRDPAGEE